MYEGYEGFYVSGGVAARRNDGIYEQILVTLKMDMNNKSLDRSQAR